MTYLTLHGSTGARDRAITQTIMLPKVDGDPHAEKRAQAVQYLGLRCVLHPMRRVPKGIYETTLMRSDVAATIRKARRRLEREAKKAKPQQNGKAT